MPQVRNRIVEIEVARIHQYYDQGQQEEARRLADDLLRRFPDEVQVRAMRARMDADDMSVAIVQERASQDLWSDQDEEVTQPMIIGVGVLGAGSLIAAIALSIKPFRYGLQHGFTSTVLAKSGLSFMGATRVPVQVLFMLPSILVIVAGLCFTMVRRYTRD